MDLRKLMMASVAVRGVYRRFAELSEEEKAQVVEKVKQKLKEKYPETGEAEEIPAEDTADETPAEDTPTEETPAEEAPAEEAPAEGGEDSDMVDVNELDWSDKPAEDTAEGEVTGEGETTGEGEESGETEAFPEYAEGEAQSAVEGNPDESAPEEEAVGFGVEPESDETEQPSSEEPPANEGSEEEPAEDEEEPAEGDEEDESEEGDEEETEEGDEETEMDEATAVPAKSGTPMGDIADDLAEDVDEIREEGKVDPAHVLDLFENMMGMVTLLVRSTPPDDEENKGKVDEEKVACRVAEASIAERVVANSHRR